MKFKSKHEFTISFSAESFDTLLSKDWDTIDCIMVSGRIVTLTRNQVICLWAKSRDWRRVRYSPTMVKVLKVA